MSLRSALLASLSLLAFAAPVPAQGVLYDIDLAQPGGTRVMAGLYQGIYTASPGGPVEATAYSGSTVEGPVIEVAVDPIDPKVWLGAVAVPGKVTVARLVEGSSAFSTIPVGASGNPTDLEFSPTLPGVVLLSQEDTGASETGIYRSEDGGWTWSPVPTTAGFEVSEIAHSKNEPDAVVAFTVAGERLASFDGGRTWSGPNPMLLGRPVSLISSQHTPQLWYAVTDNLGVWRSDDGAVSWTQLQVEGRAVHENPNVPDMLWIAGKFAGLQFSPDRGETWSQLEPLPPGSFLSFVLDVDFDPATGDVLVSGSGDDYVEMRSAVTGLGQATEGSGGVRPRHWLGGIVRPDNGEFAFRGDRCAPDSLVIYVVGRDEVALPLFGGTVHVGGTIVSTGIAKTEQGATEAGTPGAGSFAIKAPLPDNPALVGAQFVTQYAVLDAGATDPSTVVLSTGLRAIGQP